jgi:hypothetical protein
LGRDITRPTEKAIKAIPIDKELAAKYTAQLKEKLRTQAQSIRGDQSVMTTPNKNNWVIGETTAVTTRPSL